MKANMHGNAKYRWLTYKSRNDRGSMLHTLYDAVAFAELQPVLFGYGYDYDGLLQITRDLTCDMLSDAELLVMTTRIPEEPDFRAKRTEYERANSPVENAFQRLNESAFEACHRDMVIIGSHIFLEQANRRRIEFFQSKSGQDYFRGDFALYKSLAERSCTPSEADRSCAFLLYTPQLWPQGPAGLATFGMSGSTTLIWNVLLRTRFADDVGSILRARQPQFWMVEFPIPDVPATFRTDIFDRVMVDTLFKGTIPENVAHSARN